MGKSRTIKPTSTEGGLVRLEAGKIEAAIRNVRGERVIVDADLAFLYGVLTKRLNEQVKRNVDRFGPKYAFRLTSAEFDGLRSQSATSKTGRGGRRYAPWAFTEHGVVMAATVLDRIKGVDVFRPQTGEVVSSDPDDIACWFIDTDYNEESFFVRHSYFLGANDPYKALKTTLKAEVNQDAWATLHSDTSRPFDKPKSGRIAVKVINHLGDEVMKVFRVS